MSTPSLLDLMTEALERLEKMHQEDHITVLNTRGEYTYNAMKTVFPEIEKDCNYLWNHTKRTLTKVDSFGAVYSVNVDVKAVEDRLNRKAF